MAGGIVGSPNIRFDICGGALVVLIGLTLFFEIATQYVHKMFADDKTSMEMLQKLEMELMILGFLSFSVVMSNEYNLPWIPNESWFHAFEFAHILLFYAACGLMVRAVIMRRALRKLVKNMDRLGREDIRVTLDKFIASTEQKQDLASRIKLGVFGSTDSNPRWDLAWQIMRKVVPRKPGFRNHHRAREVDDDFDFARYCELVVQRDIVQSVHISGPIWAVVGVIGFIVTLTSMDFDQPLDTSGTGPMGANVAGALPAGSSPCNTALPVSDDSVTGAAAAEFGALSATNLVSGVVTFSQEAASAVIAIDLQWNIIGDLAWHIHEQPVNALGECGASSTGGHYIPECTTAADWCSPLHCPSTPLADRAGELSARVGNLCSGLSTCLSADDQRLFEKVGGCGAAGQLCLNSNGRIPVVDQRQIVRLPADSIIQLSGRNTVIGRSIVIHNADGARIACATIEPPAGRASACQVPDPTGEEGDAVAAFTDDGMTFSMMFTETDSTGCAGGSYTTITMRVNGAASGLPPDVGGWHVHENPRSVVATTTAEACGNGATGGHYDPECFGSDHPAGIGELTHRHGPLRPEMPDGTTWIDSHLPLRGPNSIVGRSIVIHNADGDRIACATIEPAAGRASACQVPDPTGEEGDAVAAFTDDGMTFSMMFTETDSTGCAGGSYTTITMRVNGAASGLPPDVGGWHVHENPRSVVATTTAEACGNGATGGHYDPECFGSDHPAGIGELTHRHGPLRPEMPDGTTWIDSHLPLRGPNSIVGRSIVIHNADGDRIACATIEAGQGAGRRHLASNTSSVNLEAARRRPPAGTDDAEPPSATATRGARSTPKTETIGISEMRRRLAAGSEMMYMQVEDARGTVLVIVLFCWITTILLHVVLYIQHVEMVKLLKHRGWQSDDADVLRACVDNLVSAKQLRDTAIEIEHGEAQGGGHVHGGHSHGLCAMSGYTAKEQAFNFITDTLICLNCFYSAFCVLYGLYVTAWADVGWAGQFFLNVFLFVPAGYQFLALGPSIARDRAMLTAYIHVDEELLREVEVYTARTLEIKAALCENVLQKLDEAGQLDGLSSSTLRDDERARKAAEFFFGTRVDQNADGALGPDELEATIVGLRLQVTCREIKQLVRELDVDQNGLIARQELEDFLQVNMTKTAIALNKAAAKTRRGSIDHGQRSEEGQDGGIGTQELLEQLNEESRKSQQLEAELRQMKKENARMHRSQQPLEDQSMHAQPVAGGDAVADSVSRRPPPVLSTLAEPQIYAQGGSTPTRSAATPVRKKRAPPPLPAKPVVFSQYDKDSSGSLDASEVRALLRARGISPAAADQILAKYDQNGDGALSQEEFDGLYAQLAAQTQRTAPRAVRAGSRRQAAMTGQSSRI